MFIRVFSSDMFQIHAYSYDHTRHYIPRIGESMVVKGQGYRIVDITYDMLTVDLYTDSVAPHISSDAGPEIIL